MGCLYFKTTIPMGLIRNIEQPHTSPKHEHIHRQNNPKSFRLLLLIFVLFCAIQCYGFWWTSGTCLIGYSISQVLGVHPMFYSDLLQLLSLFDTLYRNVKNSSVKSSKHLQMLWVWLQAADADCNECWLFFFFFFPQTS